MRYRVELWVFLVAECTYSVFCTRREENGPPKPTNRSKTNNLREFHHPIPMKIHPAKLHNHPSNSHNLSPASLSLKFRSLIPSVSHTPATVRLRLPKETTFPFAWSIKPRWRVRHIQIPVPATAVSRIAIAKPILIQRPLGSVDIVICMSEWLRMRMY